jgi:hypothetical protein
MSSHDIHPPGIKWILIVGGALFAAGFVGPMILAPSSNIGPIMGIIYTGPAGVVLGAALWALCALFRIEARMQWHMLYAIVTICVLGILLSIRPHPKYLGDVFEGRVESCALPADFEEETIDDWKQRIAKVHWAEPRTGWEAEMRETLRNAPGVVLLVQFERSNPIRQHQRLWNRSQFAEGWKLDDEEATFYDEDGDCEQYPEGIAIRGYQISEYEAGPSEPRSWPPQRAKSILGASKLEPVPERWKDL